MIILACIISALAGALLGAAALLLVSNIDREGGAAWRHEELLKIVGRRTARQLWPLMRSGQLSLFDIKSGVYTVADRTKMQKIWEQFHNDINNGGKS